MKTYIPRQPKHVRERIEAKIDARLVERLEKYCQYLESDRDYVLAQALEIIFRKDKGFCEWLAAQGTMSATASGPTTRKMRSPIANQSPIPEPSAQAAPVPQESRPQERA